MPDKSTKKVTNFSHCKKQHIIVTSSKQSMIIVKNFLKASQHGLI